MVLVLRDVDMISQFHDAENSKLYVCVAMFYNSQMSFSAIALNPGIEGECSFINFLLSI